MRPLKQMSYDRFGRFSIDDKFSSLISNECAVTLSIDGFFLVTDHMYIMVSIAFSSLILVTIGSKIIQL